MIPQYSCFKFTMSLMADKIESIRNLDKNQSYNAGVRVRGDGVLDATGRNVCARADRVVVEGVLHENLRLPVLLVVVPGQDLKIGCQLLDAEPKLRVLVVQHLVSPRQLLQLGRQLSDLDLVLLRDHGPIHIDGHLDGRQLHRHLDSPLHLHRPVDVHRLVDVYRLLHNGRHLDRLDDLPGWLVSRHRYFLLHLDVLGHFHYLFDYPLGSGDVLGHLDLHLDGLLDDHLLYYLLRHVLPQPFDLGLLLLEEPFEEIYVHFELVLVALQLVDLLLMAGAALRHVLVILELNSQLHVLFIGVAELFGELVDFFKQLLQALLVLGIIFLNLDLDFLVPRRSVVLCQCDGLGVDPLGEGGHIDGHEWLHFPPIYNNGLVLECGANFFGLVFLVLASRGRLGVDGLLLLDDDGLLDDQVVPGLTKRRLVDPDLHVGAGVGVLAQGHLLAVLRCLLGDYLLQLADLVLETGRHSKSLCQQIIDKQMSAVDHLQGQLHIHPCSVQIRHSHW